MPFILTLKAIANREMRIIIRVTWHYYRFICSDSCRDWRIMRHKYIYIYARPCRFQTPGPAGLRHLPLAPWAGASSTVPAVGFFRSARPAPAQIREFALAAKRAVFAGPGGERVWF